MDQTRLCMRCMRETAGFEVCMHCGFVNSAAPEQPFELAPGSVINDGRYFIGAAIRFDSREIWYAGFDLASQRRVHIREYYPQALAMRGAGSPDVGLTDPACADEYGSGRTRFRAEMETVSRVSGHGILRVYDVFDDCRTTYAVTEFLDGSPLCEFLIKNSARPALSAIYNVAVQLVAGIEALHEHDLIHLGINTESIWMCDDGTLRIATFGNMGPVPNAPAARTLMPGTAAPELYSGDALISSAADIYSLAAVLYRLFTGSFPPDAVDRAAADKYEKLSSTHCGANAAMSRAVDRALSMSIQSRYTDVGEFIQDFSSPDAPSDTGLTLSKSSTVNAKKHRRALPIAAALLAAFLGLLMIIASICVYTVPYSAADEKLASSIAKAGAAVGDYYMFFGSRQTENPAEAFVLAGNAETLNDCIDAGIILDDGSDPAIKQYIAQNGDSDYIPLGYSAYIIYINKGLSDKTVLYDDPAAQIAALAAESGGERTGSSSQATTGEILPSRPAVGILDSALAAFEYLYGEGAEQTLNKNQKHSFAGDKDIIAKFTGLDAAYIIGSTADYSMIESTGVPFDIALLFVPEGKAYPVKACTQYAVGVRSKLGKENTKAAALLVNEFLSAKIQLDFFSSLPDGSIMLPINSEACKAFIDSMNYDGDLAGIPAFELFFMRAAD